jgi:hypothetical protein
MSESEKNSSKFEELGSDKSLVSEFIDFVKHNRKFWLIPILCVLGLLGLLVVLGGSSAAPFIYTLF